MKGAKGEAGSQKYPKTPDTAKHKNYGSSMENSNCTKRTHRTPQVQRHIFSLEFYWYISKKINSIAAGLGEDYLVQWKNPKKRLCF